MDVIPDAATRYTCVRALAFGVLLTIAACSGPTATAPPPRTPTPSSSISSSPFPSPKPSPSPPPPAPPVVTPLPPPVAGGVVEYPIAAPGASPSAMTAGPDGNLWFADVGDPHRVSRVTTSGVITEFAVPGAVGGPETMTVGPDGNVWMVGQGGGTGAESWILRVSPKGVVTKFPVPGAGPDGITTGPDGNLWFTEFFRNMIGRMSPSGALLGEFPIPIGSPRGIVTGPDGNLWFTEAGTGSSAIARMAPSGEVSEFPLAGGSDANQFNPTAIVAGPDRNLWFTEASGGKVGRITTAGVITEFRLPGTANPQGLTVGPDGNLWFTVSEGAVGRITPSGTIRLFPLPGRNAQPIGIAAGSDGRIWFTEAGVNRVGSIGETVPEVGLAARLVTFGTDSVASKRTVSIANSGDAALSIASVKIAGDATAAFSIVRNTCRTVAIGASCQVDVAMTPRPGQGVLAGLLQFTDNATASPQSVSLVAQLPSCRLPVFTRSESPVAAQGGFLDLRTGVYAPDSRATFSFNSTTGQYQSKAVPVLAGLQPELYDPVSGRWLPAGSASTSPDHSRYAYTGFPATSINRPLHVVDVATGRDRVISLPRQGPWNVVGFDGDGVYLNQSYEGIGAGLTLANPDTGTVRAVFADGVVYAVGNGAAWVGGFNTKDPVPPPPSMGGSNNEVVRRDLATGQKTIWLYVSGANLYVAAVSQSTLLVTGYFRHGAGTWIVTGANQAQRLTIPGTSEDFTFTGGLMSDAAGVWLAGPGGIYLWRSGSGLRLVSEVVATPAGTCI